MLVELVYEIRGELALTDQWPIKCNGAQVRFESEDGLAKRLIVRVKDDDPAHWPTISYTPNDKVKAHIEIRSSPAFDVADRYARTVQGMIGIYRYIRLDIENAQMRWIPESPAERSALQLSGANSRRVPSPPSLPVPFDIVARSVLRCEAVGNLEIPLNFFRRGSLSARDDDYIVAFIYFYLFLESLFGNGKYKANQILPEFLKSVSLCTCVLSVLPEFLTQYRGRKNAFLTLLKTRPSESAVLEHLIALRGRLHHHTLERPEIWHPERQHEFEPEAVYLQYLCFQLAFNSLEPHIFDARTEREYFEMSVDAGAIQVLIFEYSTSGPGGLQTHSNITRMRVPGTKVTTDMITVAAASFMDKFKDVHDDQRLIGFKCRSEDGSALYAEYRSFLPAGT